MRMLLALLLVFWPALAGAQQSDKDYLTRLIQDNLSGAGRVVDIQGFRGALSSRASLTRMTIADDQGIWLTLQGVSLDWNRAALLQGRIEITSLQAEAIDLIRPPATGTGPGLAAEASGFRLPDLPVSIAIGSLSAASVKLGAAVLGTAAEVSLQGAMQLANGEGATTLTIQRIDGTVGALSLQGSYANASRQLALNLALQEASGGIAAGLLGLPGQPSLALKVSGNGLIDQFVASVALSTNDAPRLTGTLQLTAGTTQGQPTNRFSARLAGDIAPLFAADYRDFFGQDVRLLAEGARLPDGSLQLTSLDLQARALSLTGAVTLSPDGLPARVDVAGRIAAPDGSPVLLPLPGDRRQVSAATLALQFDAAVSDRWAGSIALENLQTTGFGARSLRLDGDGTIGRAGAGRSRQADAKLSFSATGLLPADPALAAATGTELTGQGALFWTDGSPLTLTGFGVQGTDYALNLDGTLEGPDTGLRFTGNAAASLDSAARLSQIAGRPLTGALLAEAAGSYDLLTGAFDLTSRLQGENLTLSQPELDRLLRGASQITVSARRSEQGTDLRALTLTAAGLQAEMAGTLTTDRTDLRATLSVSDLAALGSSFHGALQASATITGPLASPTLALTGTATDLRIGQAQVDALLAGETGLTLQAIRQTDTIHLTSLTLANPALQASANGTVRTADLSLSLATRFTLPNLAGLLPGLQGAVFANAEITGPLVTPTLSLDGTATDLRIGQPQIDALLAGETTVALQATNGADAIHLTSLTLANAALQASASGTVKPGESRLSGRLTVRQLSTLGSGWRGGFSAEMDLAEQGRARTLTLSATGSGLGLGAPILDRLLAGPTSLALSATEDSGSITLHRFRLTNQNLDAEASGSQSPSQTTPSRDLALKARIADMGLIAPGFTGPMTLDGTLQDRGGPYGLSFAVKGADAITARVSGTTARNFRTAVLSISGQADGGLVNGFIAPRTFQGPLRYELRLNGSASFANLSGTVSTTGAVLTTELAGLVLGQMAATATLAGGRASLQASANATSGGQIAATGSVALAPGLSADLDLTLSAVTLRDPGLYQTSLTGRIAVIGPLAPGAGTLGARITGQIDLGRTEVVVPSSGMISGAVPGLQHRNEPAAVLATRIRAGLLRSAGATGSGASTSYPLDITLNAPNRLFIRGRGLDAELGGTVQLTGSTAAIQPIGEFTLIRGRLDILGKRFSLDEGLARLQGRFLPFLRLVATTSSDGITSAITLEGDANAPKISFTSTPELPEEEVLARLLFGRALTTISPLQAAQLASAVATLAGKGGEGLISRLRKGFGLDDLDIQTDAEGKSSLKIGKYLTEQVYTDVTIDENGKSNLSLNLDLTPSVTLRGSVGSEGKTGLGVFFEKDY